MLANVKERDQRDTTRAESPLRKASDALELDNSHIGIEEQLQWALDMFNKSQQKMNRIEIDSHSGCCFGVAKAISRAEEELQKGGTLYCLGDIVHNNIEVERLEKNGIDYNQPRAV